MERNDFVPHDTEDKNWWCHHGENLEVSFVEICREQLHLDMQINPEKAKDRYAPDLIVHDGEKYIIADLKTQNTPFFTASRYGMDPRYAVTFNRKDYTRYKTRYPDIVIFFWLDWVQTRWKDQEVAPLAGIFQCPFRFLLDEIEKGNAKEHFYLARKYDTAGNAKSSFLFDVRSFHCLFKDEQ